MIGLLLAACQGPPQSEPHPSGGDAGIDADGDGYDVPADCDDADPAVHPGNKETCGNGIDDNCNSTSDGCDWSGDSILQGMEIATEENWSSLGSSFAICDANGDGQLDLVAGAWGAYDYSGAVYVFYGPIDSDRDAKDADYIVTGTIPIGLAGYAVDCGGDWNGDGIGDLVVGEPNFAKGHTRGTIYVVPGGDVGTAQIADVATSAWVGTSDEAQLGYAIALLDLDGNGIEDIATTTWATPHHQVDYGHVYVFADPAPGTGADVDATATIYGTENDELSGAGGNAGDLDGDGLDELAVAGRGSEKTDAAFIFRAPLHGELSKADADVRIDDDVEGFGSALGHADLDDDGADDLLVGNQLRNGGAGAAYVFYGNIREDTSTAAADVRLMGGTPASRVGCAIASPGDIDGDGKAELLIGAWQASTVYLHYGGDPGVYDLADAQASWRREEKTAAAGFALATGDVSGDGFTDLGSAAPGLGNGGEGAIFLMPSFDL